MILLSLMITAFTLLAGPTRADVIRWIYEDAALYGASATELIRVGECESNLQPYAVGDHGHSIGPFQWFCHYGDCRGSLWARTPAGRAGISRWDTRQNVRMAAWAFGQHPELKHHWSCYRYLYYGGN